AAGGTLDKVTVTLKGRPVAGKMADDKTRWRSRTLRPGARYQVTAVATSPEGKSTTVNSTLATHKAPQELRIADVTPSSNEKAVERVLDVKSTKPATGAWHWQNDTTVIFRTKNDEYWKPNQKVMFRARLAGVKTGKGTYGVADFKRGFRIGDAHMTIISTK